MAAVVSDTSPLVYLTRLGHFDWLQQLYSEVLIPAAVWDELVRHGAAYPEPHECQECAINSTA
jgi:predicted nucleic acid-binding protein